MGVHSFDQKKKIIIGDVWFKSKAKRTSSFCCCNNILNGWIDIEKMCENDCTLMRWGGVVKAEKTFQFVLTGMDGDTKMLTMCPELFFTSVYILGL